MQVAINYKIKIGDKVVCIENLYIDGKQIFIANRFYFVRDIQNYKRYDLIKVDNIWFAFAEISELQFDLYFKTLGEYRENRINEILNYE